MAAGVDPPGPPQKAVGFFANGNKQAEQADITDLSSVTAAEIYPPGPPRRVIMVMGLGGSDPNTIILRRASNHAEVARFDVPPEHSSALLELAAPPGGLEAILDQPADDISCRVWSEE